ncbi:hypothetical protein XENOCAPTIV_017832 [Xenoophorus captivus]|uniref:Uncharacterized protein n=1 Tax=Xenoophorus captivus TaxID=1517983 RepID=A0ABV0QN07_9TELE
MNSWHFYVHIQEHTPHGGGMRTIHGLSPDPTTGTQLTELLCEDNAIVPVGLMTDPSGGYEVTGKRSEGKEASDFQGGEYEAAVNQEKQDDRRSLQELPGGDGASGEADSGSEQEEVSVAALNVSLTAASVSSAGSSRTRSILLLYAQAKRFSHQAKLEATAVHWACRGGCLPALQLLLDQGAKITSRDKDGKTPLEMLYSWQNGAKSLLCNFNEEKP